MRERVWLARLSGTMLASCTFRRGVARLSYGLCNSSAAAHHGGYSSQQGPQGVDHLTLHHGGHRSLHLSPAQPQGRAKPLEEDAPAMAALGGGVGIAVSLYQLGEKVISRALTDKSVLILTPRPTHDFQPRREEMRRLMQLFKELRAVAKQKKGGNVASVVYITGRPTFGKSQIARDFGENFYHKNRGRLFKNLFVGTINASSWSSIFDSYLNIAVRLGCMTEMEVLGHSQEEFQNLELLSTLVRKELRQRPGWFVIIDNLTSDVKYSLSPHSESSLLIPPTEERRLRSLNNRDDSAVVHNRARDSTSSPPTLSSVKAVRPNKVMWQNLWPQPGDTSWGRGHVIVTTSNRSLVEHSSPYVRELELKRGMSEKDALVLLEKVSMYSGVGEREEMKKLVNILEGVPLSVARQNKRNKKPKNLAVDLQLSSSKYRRVLEYCMDDIVALSNAAFYMKQERLRNPSYTCRDYLRLLESGVQQESEEMLTLQNVSYPITMATAVAKAAQELASSDTNLHKVFLLLVSCARSPVPLSLIARVLGIRQDINSAAMEAVRSCVFLSFSTRSPGVKAVSLYREAWGIFRNIFLEVGPSSLPDIRPGEFLQQVVKCMVMEYEAEDSRFDAVSVIKTKQLLLPHLEAIPQVEMDGFHLEEESKLKILFLLGDAYTLMGHSSKAKSSLEEALELSRRRGDYQMAARVACKLGSTYRHLAMREESEHVLTRALETVSEAQGRDKRDGVLEADLLTILGSTYRDMGCLQESIECLQTSIAKYENLLGPKSSSVAAAMTTLGSTWTSLGDNFKSKQLFEKALSIQEELYEPNHPSIAFTLGKLSTACVELGDLTRSISLLERALAINRSAYGEDHISVAIVLSRLSNAYRMLGKMKMSKNLAQRALQMTEEIQGSMHPGVATSLELLGSIYCDLGEFNRAHELLERSININSLVGNGSHFLATASSQSKLGMVARLGGSLEEARQLLEVALESREEELGRDHPGNCDTLVNLGKVYHELGLLTKSLLTFERAQKITTNLYSHCHPSHPQITFVSADMARVKRDAGELDEAIGSMERAIVTYESVLKSSEDDSLGYTNTHPKYASMHAILGLMKRDAGKLDEAKRCLERALEIQDKIVSPQNLMRAETIGNLGTVHHRLGKHQKAMDAFKEAIGIMRHLRSSHVVTSTILAATGILLEDIDELQKAERNVEHALETRIKCCGTVHPNIALYHVILGRITSKIGDTFSAKSHTRKAEIVYQALIQREEEMSKKANVELNVLQDWKYILDHID